MGVLSLISEDDTLELFGSRVSTELIPQSTRSVQSNPPLTSKSAKSSKSLSIEDDSLGFLDSIGSVDEPPPQTCHSFRRNLTVTSSFLRSRASIEPRRSFYQNPHLTSSFSNSRECINSDSSKSQDVRVLIQNPPVVSSSSSRACDDDNSLRLLNSRVSVDPLPEPRRSFHWNPQVTSYFTKFRKILSVERIDPVPEPRRSARLSTSSYGKLGLVTVEDNDTQEWPHHRRRLSISSVLSCVSSKSSFYYDKLAQLPIRLTIVKLDGSSFDVDVMKNATVADLKQAIENLFSCLSIEEAGMISWQHVWGSFCLSYGGFKLLDEGENLREYGMKDGDKLHFIQHTSITKDPTKKQTRKRIDAPKRHAIIEDEVEEDYVDSENMPLKRELEDNLRQRQSFLHRFFRGWSVYSQVSSGKRLTYEGTRTTTRSGGFVGCFRSSKDKPQSYSSKSLRLESFE